MDILVRHLDRCCCSLCSNALFASLMFRSLEPNSIQSNCVTTKYTMWITLAHTHSLSPKCTAHAVQFDFDFGFASSKGYPFEHMLETFFFGFENKGNREDREQASKPNETIHLFNYNNDFQIEFSNTSSCVRTRHGRGFASQKHCITI